MKTPKLVRTVVNAFSPQQIAPTESKGKRLSKGKMSALGILRLRSFGDTFETAQFPATSFIAKEQGFCGMSDVEMIERLEKEAA